MTRAHSAAHVYEQVNLAMSSIDEFMVQEAVTGNGVESAFEELWTKVQDLRALTHPLKDRPVFMDTLQKATTDLTTLRKRYDDDNPNSKSSVNKDVQPVGTSRYDRLPRIELPSFKGENMKWHLKRLKKDPTLTDVEKLSFFTQYHEV